MRLWMMIVAMLVMGTAVAEQEPPGEVTVGGELILRIRFSAGGMTPKQRAAAITSRLRTILQDPTITPEDIVVRPIAGGEAAIYVKENLIVTVDKQHARLHRTTPLQLGEIWAQHLRKVIPQITVQPIPGQEEDSSSEGGA